MGLENDYEEQEQGQGHVNQQTVEQNSTNQEQELTDISLETAEAIEMQNAADNSPDALAMTEWIAGVNTSEEANMTAMQSNELTAQTSLKSPLFKQHMRLRTLAMLPNDRFVKGSSGAGVFAIQQALKKLYPREDIGQYGVYGKETIALVKKFQGEEGLGTDGDFGQQTLLALDQYSFPRIAVTEEGSSIERVEGFDVKEEINRPAKISATANDLAIAEGRQTLEHQDRSEDKGIHHNQDVSGVRIYSGPTKNSKLKFTLNYDTDVTLVGEYAYESSWSLIQTADGKEGWINSDYVTQGISDRTAANLAQSDLTMIGKEHANLGDLVQDRYGSSFVQEQDARLIIQAVAFMNDGRAAIYYEEEEHNLSWWERLLLNSTEEEARSIYQNIGIRSGMNIILPNEALILQMKEAGVVSSGSIRDKFEGAIDFLKMYGGYNVGLLEGLWDGLVNTLKAVPDLLKMVWDLVKAAFQGELFSKLGEILSSIWEFIKNLPQTADNWWEEFKQKSPFEQGRTIGNGIGQIAFEVILAVFTGGAINALKATGVGAKIVAATSKINNTIGRFGDDLAVVSQRMLNDVGDVVLPKQVVTPDGQVLNIKRNDLLDHDGPQNMRMDGDRDGGGRTLNEDNIEVGPLLSAAKSKLTERINNAKGFTLRHTDEELSAIIEQGKALNLSNTEIDDLLFISCRDAKPLSSSELIQQMDNWVNVVQKRGYPYKFTSLEEFKQFSNDLKKGLSDIGVSNGDVRIQGSSLRTPKAGDVDLVVFINNSNFNDYLVKAFDGKVKTKSGEAINLANINADELFELARDIRNNTSGYNSRARTFAHALLENKISSKTTKPEIILGLRDLRKQMAENYPHLNVEDISFMTKGGNLDLEPNIKL